MKRISVYVKGDRNSPAYYRIYQYIDNLENEYSCKYRMQMSPKAYSHWMPVSKQPYVIKLIIYIYIYTRVFKALFLDLFQKPDIIILHRTLIGYHVSYCFRMLLKIIISRGCKLIWDFDDQIIENGEISEKNFKYLSKLSNDIVVTHDYLKSIVPDSYKFKVKILPTTDGDMYRLFNTDLNIVRQNLLEKQVVLVWVATSVNLPFIKNIIPILDIVSTKIKKLKGKQLVLKVVCNEPLLCTCVDLVIKNIKWTREKAISEMMSAHIGIMPLIDNAFTRGKGGFKLIQYLSIGLPCIGSDVGYNKAIITNENGFLVDTEQDWIDAIINLSDKNRWVSYSDAAFNTWLKKFNYNENMRVWNNLIFNS